YDLKSQIPGGNQKVLRGHLLDVTDIKFSNSSRYIITGSRDNTARIWDINTESATPDSVVLKGHDGWISSLAVTNDGKWLATAGYDRSIRLWNIPSVLNSEKKQETLVLAPQQGFTQKVEFSPDGNSLISLGNDRSIQIWDMTSDTITEHSVVLKSEVSSFLVGEKGRWLVMSNQNEEMNTVQLWPLDFDGMVAFATRFSQSMLSNEECEQAEMYARQLEQKLR
ncbi:MAG: WD40 repeat domain-containing protein, partial [Thermoguttaceae bacterium]